HARQSTTVYWLDAPLARTSVVTAASTTTAGRGRRIDVNMFLETRQHILLPGKLPGCSFELSMCVWVRRDKLFDKDIMKVRKEKHGYIRTCTRRGFKRSASVSTKPSINYCLITAEVNVGSSVEKVEISCADESNTVVYSNVVATTVKIEVKTAYRGPSATTYPRKYYINDFKVGITSATFHYTITRESSTGKTTTPDSTHSCNPGTSQSNPETGIFDCSLEAAIVNTPLQHADRFHFVAETSNGGYVTINNYDSSGTYGPKYYSGQTTTHKSEFVIDLVKPFHCSVGSTCTDNMLDRGPPVTKSEKLKLRWAGWSDALAGIKLYELAVYKMKAFGYKLTHNGETALVRETLDATTRVYNTTLIDPGVYAVVLTAEDNAGNHQTARRFLIFDNVNVVSINTAEDKVLVVNSAAENTSYTWLTSLQSSSYTGDQASNVDIYWRGHFANVFHNTHKFLNGSSSNSPPIAAGYEELTGQPPDTVSREAIPNVNGIVKYEVSRAVDHDGGRSLNSPDSWSNVDDFQRETMTVDIPREDGDSVRVWVRATDVMGNTKTDSVLVHVDSSPPVVQDVWLSRHGRTQLAVHHSTDLSDLTFEFESYDYHSGLKTIHWRLHDSVDPDLTHGSGHVAVRRHKITPDMSKMVKPHGDHDFDYDLVITSTNNAMLTTVFTYKITVDTTAPHTGVVSDSEQSQPDIDFQQEFTQHASWQGFFDRESGVMFYQYAFSDACLTANVFTVPPTGNVKETTLTYASRTVSGPGTYHCTVVAYNKALEPSEPVCSDGVTVDTSAPEIHEVSVENSWTKDGLVKDSTGHVWYIDRNRFRVLVEQPSDSCR
ncbi:hypothetical protein NP493_1549g00001, partial [Ridgeia piscesae]